MSDDDARDHRRVTLERLDTGVYRATNPRGATLDFGSKHEQGFSPVELLLAAIGGCSAVDVDMVTGRPLGLRTTSRSSSTPTRSATTSATSCRTSR